MKRLVIPLAMLLVSLSPGRAMAAALTATKTASVISDPVGDAAPKSLPGAVVDYKILFGNPNSVVAPVAGVVVSDILPATVKLRVLDIVTGSGQGPVEFLDGNVIGTGLVGSGLTCSYAGLASTTDCFDFSSDGTTWTYTPVADANGYDANVRGIRLKSGATFAAGGSFQIRYRVMIR